MMIPPFILTKNNHVCILVTSVTVPLIYRKVIIMKRTMIILLAMVLLASCGSQPDPSTSQSISMSESSSLESSVPSSDTSSEDTSSQSKSDIPLELTPDKPAPSSHPQPVIQPTAAPDTWWAEGLSLDKLVYDATSSCGSPVSRYYLYDDKHKVSYNANDIFSASPEDDNKVTLITNTAKEVTDSVALGERILVDHFFEIVALDDTKYTIAFYEKGITLTRSLPSVGKGDVALLAIATDDYATIQANILTQLDSSTDGFSAPRPSWLTMMRKSRMESITLTSADGKSTETYSPDDPSVVSDITPRIEGDRGSSSDMKSLPNSVMAEITFNNDLIYKVYYSATEMLVTTNDTDRSMHYPLPDDRTFNNLDGYAEGFSNPMTGKPVIYLYPTQPTDCKVTVDYPQFSYTYPTYNKGWDVTAYPDGRLINKADNSEHFYLFWEGNERIDWIFDRGFVVKGSDTEAFLLEKLPLMGLTPREYNDFITYWVPLMKHEPYNLITFADEQYEALAPLTVTPTPDSVLRVHMVFKGIDAPIAIPAQELPTFERKGFTVVEWGGTNANY